MGAKAWFIAYFDGDPKAVLAGEPVLDHAAARALADQLMPGAGLEPMEDGGLSFLNPDRKEVFAGHYGGLRIVAHEDLGIDHPSKIDPRWLDPALGANAYVHATHSVVDWFAFGLWRNGELIRSLSLSPDDGIIEQTGAPLSFEAPYWAGQHPADDEDDEDLEEDDRYPLPFHPLDLAEVSLLHHLGFQFEGRISDWVCDPADIAVARYAITKRRPFWKFW